MTQNHLFADTVYHVGFVKLIGFGLYATVEHYLKQHIADMKKDGVNADNISHLLSVCTEISESAGVDAEEALYRANNAFTEQFRENYGK